MRAIVHPEYGNPEVLRVATIERPAPHRMRGGWQQA